MEPWEQSRPALVTPKGVGWALVLHAVAIGIGWLLSLPIDEEKETVIPIDLTVVVHENLDGNENEPPPVRPPPPEPTVKPTVKPPPPPAPVVEDRKVDAVVQVAEKKPPKKPKPPKKTELPKKPDPPKKSAKELREERIRKMRASATPNKRTAKTSAQPQPNGRTERRPPNWQTLLNAGYKPGASTALAADDEQLCVSLIYQAFYDQWTRPPWTASLKTAQVAVWFDKDGRIVNYRLTSSSGDAAADRSVLAAASRVGIVRGLLPKFLEKNRTSGVLVNFKVTPQ